MFVCCVKVVLVLMFTVTFTCSIDPTFTVSACRGFRIDTERGKLSYTRMAQGTFPQKNYCYSDSCEPRSNCKVHDTVKVIIGFILKMGLKNRLS